jgi:hypothetical protein
MCGFLAAMDILLSLFENVQVPLGTMHKADTKDPCAEYYHFLFLFNALSFKLLANCHLPLFQQEYLMEKENYHLDLLD